jgi:toxin ParE1/3/4
VSATVPDKVARYVLTPRARADMEDIWQYGANTWSPDAADRYTDELARILDLIASMPTMGRQRPELSPPVHLHVHQAHLIVYQIHDDHILIVRVLGGRQDWKLILSALDQ